jgi:hypothetical protein
MAAKFRFPLVVSLKNRTWLPSVATPDKSGDPSRTTVVPVETPALPVLAVAGPAPLAAESLPVEELTRMVGTAIGYFTAGFGATSRMEVRGAPPLASYNVIKAWACRMIA